MKRRALLQVAAGTALIGNSTLSGCLGRLSGPGTICQRSDFEYSWCHGADVSLDGLADGTLLARTRHVDSPEAKREVVGLDADTGDVEWTFESTMGGQDTYSDLAVRDGVYFTMCGDDSCHTLHALELDGEERWTREVRAGYRRPLVDADSVYAVNEDNLVRAFDAATGATQWEQQVESTDSAELVDVAGAVYVDAGDALVALDRNAGRTLRRYELDRGATVLGSPVSDEVGYVLIGEQLTAVADETERWRRDLDAIEDTVAGSLAGVAAGHLFVVASTSTTGYRLDAFDVESGTRSWTAGLRGGQEVQVALHGDVAYVGTDRIRALDAATGDERWSVPVDAPIRALQTVPATGTGTHDVFAEVGDGRFLSISPAGERLWESAFDGDIRSYLIGEHVYVATDEAIYALDRRDES